MRGFWLAVLLGGCAATGPESGMVGIPAPGVVLNASYAVPAAAQTAPAVVALHGCGGPWAARDGQWRDTLVGAGHAVVFPDSFGSRGLGSQCTVRARTVSPGRERREDALAAARWLAARPGAPHGGVVMMGWSNGGTTVLAAAGSAPAGLARGFVAFYPGCGAYADRARWAPVAPLLIVIGAADDWTPAEPCKVLAARFPERITLVLVPGAYHDFDVPGRPVRVRHGLAFTAGGSGAAHAGTDEAGRLRVLRDVPAWIAALPAV